MLLRKLGVGGPLGLAAVLAVIMTTSCASRGASVEARSTAAAEAPSVPAERSAATPPAYPSKAVETKIQDAAEAVRNQLRTWAASPPWRGGYRTLGPGAWEGGPARRSRRTPDPEVAAALAAASVATGVSHDYLLATAARESAFDPRAAAPTSSARGLFQFIESTWLEMVGRYGARHGLAAEQRQVRFGWDGRPEVADPEARRRMLALRFDPGLASVLAAELARENAAVLSGALGRAPSDGELYAAHFLGAEDAARLIATASREPSRPAADMFPRAAAANRSIFFEAGQARTVEDVLRRLA